MAVRGAMLIARLAELTGASDGEISSLLNIPRSTVQAYRVGRISENLTEQHVQQIVAAAHVYLEQVRQAVAELELFT